jgi:hypothetical protein
MGDLADDGDEVRTRAAGGCLRHRALQRGRLEIVRDAGGANFLR